MTTYDTSLDPISPDFDPCSWGPQAGAMLTEALSGPEKARMALKEGQERFADWQAQIDDHATQADAHHVRDVMANGDAVVVTLVGVPASWTMQRVNHTAAYGARRSGHTVTEDGAKWAGHGGVINVFLVVTR